MIKPFIPRENTIDKFGDEETFKMIVENTTDEFIDDTVTSFKTNIFSSNSKMKVIEVPKLKSISGYSFAYNAPNEELYVGIDNDSVCSISSTVSSIEKFQNIYVPEHLCEQYKSATNWAEAASVIKPCARVVECRSLSITAEDVKNGKKTKTKIHFIAECTYMKSGVLQDDTIVVEDDAESEPFPENTLYEPVNREITFSFLGMESKTTITQGAWVDNEITIETPVSGTSYVWVTADNKYQIDGYKCYMSNSKGVGNSKAVMKLTFIKYSEITIYIRSYAESSYDYTIASGINASSFPTAYNSSGVKAHTRNNQKAGTTLSDYTAVTYTGLKDGDYVYISYVKDSSGDSYDDRGFVLIPQI